MKNKLLQLASIALLVVILFFVFVSKNFKQTKPEAENNDSKINIVASFYPIFFFASKIGGEHVRVVNITPSGAEPHDYEPTTSDIAKIENSNLVIINGGVEVWADKIKDSLNNKNISIVKAGDGLLTQDLAEEGKTSKDPHVWLDPTLAKKEVEKISEALQNIDSDNSQIYKQNTILLKNKLDSLDADFKKELASCKTKDIITSHAAFGYLSTRYDLQQVSIAGLSPDEEPSEKQLTEISKFAKANKVKYIFFENLVSPKLSETIANEIGAKTLVLNPLEGLTDDQMQKGENYFSQMQQNLKNLKIALECT